MIDCHAHLADTSFDADREQVLERARAAGLEAVLCVSEDEEDARRVLAVCRRHDLLRPCLGLHPERAGVEPAAAVCALVREEAAGLAAIGEVGLDYWLAKEEPARGLQREVLAGFVALSRETGLPLNVHSRSAGHHALDLLQAEGAERVLLHAFDGKASHALRGVDLGYRFSIPPSIVRSRQKQKLARRLPLEALLLESDAPVLGPDRDARNEPANVGLAAEAIARLQDRSLEEVVARTTRNARELFGLEPHDASAGRPGA